MTELLCLKDAYLKECETEIIEATGKELVLGKTVFYPRGGGQPSDTGKITNIEDGTEYNVISVSKKDGHVIHEVDKEGLAKDMKINCKIDWERRYKLMRSHTAAHTLAAIMNRDAGVLITGNQIEEDKVRFDFNLESLDKTLLEQIIKITNEVLQKDIPLRVYTLPREEAMKIPGVVKLAGALPPSISELRIVEIPGIDIQADGGTHVKNLKEVGQIELLKLENKGKDNKRVYFKLI